MILTDITDLTHYLLPHPFLHLCTENLTPFLSLLPSKGLSGLSSLLAQPGTVFSWGFKSEGIEVIMPDETSPGRWRGWWEGVVDLVPEVGPFPSNGYLGEAYPGHFRKQRPRF
jgi:phosphatidylinositol glycan class T